MDALNLDLLLRLLVAHLLSDFIFQTSSQAKKKNKGGIKSTHFWFHILITAITLSIVIWDWHLWQAILIITISHLIIDAIKSKFFNTKKLWIFIVDQLLHLLILLMVWLYYTNQEASFFNWLTTTLEQQNLWLGIAAYIAISIPSSVLIGNLTQKWDNQLKKDKKLVEAVNEKDIKFKKNKKDGLSEGGKWIGIMERFLILTFMIIGKTEVIGFLLAAKSVFRFGELKNTTEHKKTEYIIIGTFLSFTVAIIIGLVFLAVKL